VKKKIKNKTYNTKTGIHVAYHLAGRGDTKICESLYHTLDGNYFLHGRGGSLTKWNGGEDIVALTVPQAEEWRNKYE